MIYKNIMLGIRQLETHSKPMQIHERWLIPVYSVIPVVRHHLRWFTISLISYCIFLGSLPGAMKERSQRWEKTLVQKSKKEGTNFFDQIATNSQRRKHDHNNEMITEHNKV